jgi:hypothetical protein
MGRPSRRHSSDEFGKTSTAGGQFSGLDGPMIGAAASIIVDGIAERESGKTPGPPPFTLRTAIIALVAMLVIGLVGAALVIHFTPKAEAPVNLYSAMH